MPSHHALIETAPASHIYTGGLLCNLQQPRSELTPDYLCGQLTWDGAQRALNWYHWNGSGWTRTILSDLSGIAVGMDVADLTENGRNDVVSADWPLGEEADRSDGHIFWYEQPDDPFRDPWSRHLLAPGWGKAHDLHIGDIAGLGRPDVLVRLKDGAISWYAMGDDSRAPWAETRVTEALPGDGTALWDITGSGSTDIATGAGFFENTAGDGSHWDFHPYRTARDLDLDIETRVVAGDLLGDGTVAVVIAESEIVTHARLVLLHSRDGGETWETHILIDADRNLGALHTLRLLDASGDGRPDIFTAEMEVYLEDRGVERRPTWKLFLNQGNLEFAEHTVLDANLGAHMGGAGRIASPDRIDFIAKNWQANSGNACGGLNHVVHVTGECVQ